MWYEALPGLIIIGSCIAFTGWGLKVVDRLFQEGKVTEEKKTVCSYLVLKRCCLDFKQVELSSHDKCQDLFQTLLQPSRYNVDKFDQRMIDRDEKITGSKFRQKVSLLV